MKEYFLSSFKNPIFKKFRKLKSRKEREKEGLFLIEGKILVRDALFWHYSLFALLLKEGLAIDDYLDVEDINYLKEMNIPIYRLTEDLYPLLFQVKTVQGIGAVLFKKEFFLQDFPATKNYSTVFLLDDIQDPGNLGSIFRISKAFEVAGCFLGSKCCDPYNLKVIRGSMGAIFSLPFIFMDLKEALLYLKKKGYMIVGTVPSQGVSLFNYSFKKKKVAFILGNEATGISACLKDFIDVFLTIPISIESLNVAITGSIFLYEFKRQSLGK